MAFLKRWFKTLFSNSKSVTMPEIRWDIKPNSIRTTEDAARLIN